MKKIFRLIFISIIILLAFSIYNFVYANEEDGRLVDIPVPPASSGHADVTSEESEQQTEDYEKQQKNNTNEFNYNEDIEAEQKRENESSEKNIQNVVENNTEVKNNEIVNEDNNKSE